MIVRYGYGVYAWIVLAVVIVPVLAGLLIASGVRRRRRIAKIGATTVLWLIGSPVKVEGRIEHTEHRSVVVANHASYLDGIILTAALPPSYTYLIKREMRSVPIAGFVLRRLGSAFVDRADTAARHRTARRLVRAARDGGIAVFPEGTFDEHPGLKPFHTGAFRAALRAGMRVVPIVVKGSREKLPSETWLPAPGPISIRICTPVEPRLAADAAQLIELTRKRILEHLNEPDLDAAPEHRRVAS